MSGVNVIMTSATSYSLPKRSLKFFRTAYGTIEKAYIITRTRDHVKSDEYNT